MSDHDARAAARTLLRQGGPDALADVLMAFPPEDRVRLLDRVHDLTQREEDGLRQTGRTTALITQAAAHVAAGERVLVLFGAGVDLRSLLTPEAFPALRGVRLANLNEGEIEPHDPGGPVLAVSSPPCLSRAGNAARRFRIGFWARGRVFDRVLFDHTWWVYATPRDRRETALIVAGALRRPPR